MEKLSVVPVDKIPKDVQDCPTDDLLALYKVCQGMKEVCRDNEGVGLAAVQVGIPWRLFIALARNHYRYFVNCEWKPVTESKVKGVEGCLSLKRDGEFRRFEVERHVRVRMTGQELTDDVELKLVPVDMTVEGLDAVILQHEIDHQNLVLISDIGIELDIWRK